MTFSQQNKMLGAYFFVTAAYWSFMLTDGALRMLVLLRFHEAGFGPLELASLFVIYEAMGVITNLLAGWMAARFGFKMTLFAGLGCQVIALLALGWVPIEHGLITSLIAVAVIQGLAGIAKDLTKTSAKSAVKLLVPDKARSGDGGTLFRWVARLTGAKNTIKGIGFFVGAALLGTVGYSTGLWLMALVLLVILLGAILLMPDGLPKGKAVPLGDAFRTNDLVTRLSLARLFLFASRDAWFVIALPIFLTTLVVDLFGWRSVDAFFAVGGFMASWVIAYGFVQSNAPEWLADSRQDAFAATRATLQQGVLLAIVLFVATGLMMGLHQAAPGLALLVLLLVLIVFGAVFALNSSLHSFLILAFSGENRVSQDVGLYYMANALGRLLGTVSSGIAYTMGGITMALLFAAIFASIAAVTTLLLPRGAETTGN